MRLSRKVESRDTLQELHDKVVRLEQLIHQLSRPVIEHVTIERVYVQNPVLEHLEFGLDTIDIKELSGSLNLGNNFGVTSDNGKSKKQPISQTGNLFSKQKAGDDPFTKERTDSGYRFRTNHTKATNREKEG